MRRPQSCWAGLIVACVCLGPVVASAEWTEPTAEATGECDDLVDGGPEDVYRNIEYWKDRPSLLAFDATAWLQPSRDRLDEALGITFGANAYFLYQAINRETVDSDQQAFGTVVRVQSAWETFRKTAHPGRFEVRLEYRSDLAGLPAPSDLSTQIGVRALNTGFVYSNADVDLSVMKWVQTFFDGRVGVSVGRLAFDVYQDVYALQSLGRGFINRAFVVNPAIATTGLGSLGAVIKGYATEQLWLGFQIYDANAVNGGFEWDTVRERQWLKSFEIGWTPSPDRYRTDRIQATFWQSDGRRTQGIEKGWGFAMTGSYELWDRLLAFARGGYNDGGGGPPARAAFSTGFELQVLPSQAFSFGYGWARPNAPDTDDEHLIEFSYRVRVTPNVSLMPNMQFVVDPAAGEGGLSVFSLRMVLTI